MKKISILMFLASAMVFSAHSIEKKLKHQQA